VLPIFFWLGTRLGIKWGLESGRRAVEPLNKKLAEQDRLRRIERLAGGAEVDRCVEYALNAAETACEKYCNEHFDEVMALANNKLSPAAKADWGRRYDAVEVEAYRQALAEARETVGLTSREEAKPRDPK
jgi:hypothetical protein